MSTSFGRLVSVPSERMRLAAGFSSERASLIAYLVAGYPDRKTSLESLREAAKAGADIIEIGVPYGDALADGPVIARAAHQAMQSNPGGFGLAESIELAAEFRADPGVDEAPPLALMTYLNPMLRAGLAETARLAAEAGVSGFIVPDMPPDNPMAETWLREADSAGVQSVFLVAPTSTEDRLELAGQAGSGFLYCVSTTGITGERDSVSGGLAELVARVRQHTDLPVAVGFGVGTPEQAAEVAGIAEGVVVGSAIVRRQADPTAVGAFVRELAEAVHGAR